MSLWTNRQEGLLKSLYPHASEAVIRAALPTHSWASIRTRAHTCGVSRRNVKPKLPTKMIANPVIAELVRLRCGAGLHQTELARAIGINRCTLSKMERGHASPTLRHLNKWTKAVGAQIVIVEADRSVQ